MLRKLRRVAARLAHDGDPDAHVHFHRGPQGLPAACHDAGCPYPRLDP